MINEEISQSHALVAGAEVSFGTLTLPHALAEIVVNAQGQKGAENSEWRLYDVAAAGAAPIWSGVLGVPPIAGAHRLTPEGGVSAGGLYELRAFSTVTTPGPVKASLIGYDPQCCESPMPPDDSDCCAVLVWGKQTLTDLPDPCYLVPGYDNSAASSASPPSLIAPRDGTLAHLWIAQNGIGGGPGNLVYTVNVNGIPSALVAVVPVGNLSGAGSVAEVPIVEGDRIDISATLEGDAETVPVRIVASCRFGKP